MNIRRFAIVGSMLLAVAFCSFNLAAAFAGNTETSQPPWVQPDGIVDPSKLPECFQVLDADGNIILNDTGDPICISSKDIFSPASEPGATTSEISRSSDGKGGEEVVTELKNYPFTP